MMLIANSMEGVTDCLDSQFSIFGGNWDQFAPSKLFRRAALIGIDMGSLRANHRMEGFSEGFQAETICGRPVEYRKDFYIGAKMLLEPLQRGPGKRIVP